MENNVNGWLRAIDEEMVCTHLGIADTSDSYEVAKEKLNKLIAWHVAVATDLAVNGGFMLVLKDDLVALRASINGDCYMGEGWELTKIDKMLQKQEDIFRANN